MSKERKPTKPIASQAYQGPIGPKLKPVNSGSKFCLGCNLEKYHTEFYSKGSRHDSTCKNCVLTRKRIARKAKKQKKKPLGNVLVVTDLKIEEINQVDTSASLNLLESLLRQFTFDSFCREGDGHE